MQRSSLPSKYLWRFTVNEYRAKNKLERLNPKRLHISLKTKLPNLPSLVYDTIEEYVKKFGRSVQNWLKQHYKPVFSFHYGFINYVLYDFDDFVGDSTGGIDHVKTAERMMRCDRFSNTVKFKVACMYCFEEDVRRIWPSVWKRVGFDQIQFDNCPQLYYWVCRLRNQLNKIPVHDNRSIDRIMFNACASSNRTSSEYFWNRLSPEIQFEEALSIVVHRGKNTSIESILQKLDDRQLDEFVKLKGCHLMYSCITDDHLEEGSFLQVWMCVKKVINEDVFGKLIVKILILESNREESWLPHEPHLPERFRYDKYEKNKYKKWLYRSRQVWRSAPNNLRMSVLNNTLPNLRLYEYERYHTYEPSDYERRNEDPVNSSEFLLTILSDASLKERNLFWCNCWRDLIQGTNSDDLQQIMEMCFGNNDQIIQYKENVIAGSEITRQLCVSLLTHAHFKELHELVDFCFPDKDSAKHHKQQLLQSTFLGETCIFRYPLFNHAKQFDKFINDVYGSVDLARDFKNQLISSPALEPILLKEAFSSRSVLFKEFLEFMEAFVSTEEMMQQIKTRIVDHLREIRLSDLHDYELSYLGILHGEVVLWCLENDDEVSEFMRFYEGDNLENFENLA